VFERASGRSIRRWTFDEDLRRLELVADGTVLLVDEATAVRLITIASGASRTIAEHPADRHRMLIVSPRGDRILLGDELVDARDGRVIALPPIEGVAVFSGDGTSVADYHEGAYVVYDATSGARLGRFAADDRAGASMGPDLRSLVHCRDGELRELTLDGERTRIAACDRYETVYTQDEHSVFDRADPRAWRIVRRSNGRSLLARVWRVRDERYALTLESEHAFDIPPELSPYFLRREAGSALEAPLTPIAQAPRRTRALLERVLGAPSDREP
jgi:hypothetical protein